MNIAKGTIRLLSKSYLLVFVLGCAQDKGETNHRSNQPTEDTNEPKMLDDQTSEERVEGVEEEQFTPITVDPEQQVHVGSHGSVKITPKEGFYAAGATTFYCVYPTACPISFNADSTTVNQLVINAAKAKCGISSSINPYQIMNSCPHAPKPTKTFYCVYVSPTKCTSFSFASNIVDQAVINAAQAKCGTFSSSNRYQVFNSCPYGTTTSTPKCDNLSWQAASGSSTCRGVAVGTSCRLTPASTLVKSCRPAGTPANNSNNRCECR